MRADMSKVLVEEPRHGRAYAHALVGARRIERQRLDPDGESAPSRFQMKQGHGCKSFGEHLRPLYGYLRQQVDRPWNKVYSELCQTLDRRNTIQNHLFEHLYDRVEVNTEWRDGEVWVRRNGWQNTLEPLAESFAELYVHPRTGILLVNKAGLRRRQQRRAEKAAAARQAHPDRRSGLPGQPADTVCHCIDGLWFLLTLAPLGAACQAHPAFDVLIRREVWGDHAPMLRALHGRPGVYAAAKRQLDASTLRRYGLTNLC